MTFYEQHSKYLKVIEALVNAEVNSYFTNENAVWGFDTYIKFNDNEKYHYFTLVDNLNKYGGEQVAKDLLGKLTEDILKNHLNLEK